MKAFVFSSILILAYSITEYFPRNMKLKFDISVPDEITIEFWVPQKTLAYYDWVGIGLQDSRDARDNFRCDYYIAKTVSCGLFDDRFDDSDNGLPPLDTELGGCSSITSSRTTVDKHDVFILTRKLVTGDDHDIPLYIGRPVLVKWALGNVDELGNIEMHALDDMGFEYVVLDDGYEDRNHDVRGKFGPWMETEAKILMPENQKPEKQDWSEMLESEFGRPPISSTGEFASD